jgi:hypothetical protein
MAKQETSKNSTVLPAWLPILQQYGPSLLMRCQDAIKLSKTLVTDWLSRYMFKGQRNHGQKAALISKYLADKKHLSHSRSIDIEELRRKGLKIKYSNECDPDLSEAIQNIYFSLMQTFARTGAYKVYENNIGKGFYKVVQVVVVPPQINQGMPQISPS